MSTELFDMWPLLVYPSKVMCGRGGVFPEPRPEDVVPGKDYAMYMDLGCYGIPRQVQKQQPFEAIASARKCEEFMTKHRGVPFLYASTFYTREEFEAAFNVGKGSLYEKVRRARRRQRHFRTCMTRPPTGRGGRNCRTRSRSFGRVLP